MTSSTTSSYGVSTLAAATRSRSAPAWAERTRSTARRWVIVSTHAVAEPRAGSNRPAVRHTSTSASCATSSAWAGSRTTRRARPYTRGDSRS